MGLAEKRALAHARDEVTPQYQTELQEITGTKIKYAIDWETFADNLKAMENLEDKCFKVTNEVFRKITRDEIGKEAVAEIKEIHLSQGGSSNIQEFAIIKGVLEMPWDWSSWADSFFPDSVQQKIESLL